VPAQLRAVETGQPQDSRTGPAAGRKRIIITRRSTLDYRDGINIFIFALADAFMKDGHEVTVVATTVGDQNRIARLFDVRTWPTLVSVESGPTRFSFEGLTRGWLLRGADLIRRHQPDLVINNGALPFRVAGRSCNLAHDLGWSTSRRLDPLRGPYKRFAYGRCDHVVALSSEVRLGLARQLRKPSEAVMLIPPCVDVEAARASVAATREDAILHTGTDAYKNPAATIRAFAALERDTTKLYVEGAVTDELRQLVAGLPKPTRSRIALLGELPAVELRTLLGSVRIAAFPTRYSVPTASATVVEAIAAGTPIVGSSTLSTDVLDHGRNGLACRDDAELAAAFGRLMAGTEWISMSEAAHEMAPRFAAGAIARRYRSLMDLRTH
jgi:glycosyltransferase involved in cell wall biosynthesis